MDPTSLIVDSDATKMKDVLTSELSPLYSKFSQVKKLKNEYDKLQKSIDALDSQITTTLQKYAPFPIVYTLLKALCVYEEEEGSDSTSTGASTVAMNVGEAVVDDLAPDSLGVEAEEQDGEEAEEQDDGEVEEQLLQQPIGDEAEEVPTTTVRTIKDLGNKDGAHLEASKVLLHFLDSDGVRDFVANKPKGAKIALGCWYSKDGQTLYSDTSCLYRKKGEELVVDPRYQRGMFLFEQHILSNATRELKKCRAYFMQQKPKTSQQQNMTLLVPKLTNLKRDAEKAFEILQVLQVEVKMWESSCFLKKTTTVNRVRLRWDAVMKECKEYLHKCERALQEAHSNGTHGPSRQKRTPSRVRGATSPSQPPAKRARKSKKTLAALQSVPFKQVLHLFEAEHKRLVQKVSAQSQFEVVREIEDMVNNVKEMLMYKEAYIVDLEGKRRRIEELRAEIETLITESIDACKSKALQTLDHMAVTPKN